VTFDLSTPTRRIAALAAGAVVVLLLIWYVALFRPQSNHLKSAHTARAAAEQQVAQLDGQVAGLQTLKRQVPHDTAKLAQFEAAVPSSPDLLVALDQLQQAATRSGVQLGSVGPQAPATTAGGTGSSQSGASGPPSISLSMTAIGTYSQTTAFLTALDNMPRTVVLDQLSVTGSNTGTLTSSLTARIFYSGSATH
jgi:Tfp pilus assembly protein PilO